jgi:hypothetical protein
VRVVVAVKGDGHRDASLSPGYDEILAVSRDSATWSSQATGVFYDVPLPEYDTHARNPVDAGPLHRGGRRGSLAVGF